LQGQEEMPQKESTWRYLFDWGRLYESEIFSCLWISPKTRMW